jgi:hypothetical protein
LNSFGVVGVERLAIEEWKLFSHEIVHPQPIVF